LNQETANVMYSLALLSFDAHEQSELIVNGCDPDSRSASVEQGGGERVELIWRIHEAMLRAYLQKDPQTYTRENYDQLAVYFELMRVLQRGQNVVKQVCGRVPRMSGPAGAVPSKMHAMTVHAMEAVLKRLSEQYECFNEFNGLWGVFPIDAAVFHADKLVALVEVDGEFHYKLQGQQLRRKDKLKEFLYRCQYPGVPLYRMRADQLQVIGYPRAGEALANWIHKHVQQKLVG
jgi:hypothetical protein